MHSSLFFLLDDKKKKQTAPAKYLQKLTEGKKIKVSEKQIKDNLKIGDFVRIPNQETKSLFSKNARLTNYSDEVYRIVARDRARYKLIKGADILPISYLPRQLLKVDALVFSKKSN